jgi:hypothetical protein
MIANRLGRRIKNVPDTGGYVIGVFAPRRGTPKAVWLASLRAEEAHP